MTSTQSKIANTCKIGTKWKINETDLRNSDVLNSQYFKANIPGVQYYISLFLNEGEEHEVGIYLNLMFKMAHTIMASFKFCIKSASAEFKMNEKIYHESGTWGLKICSRDELFDPKNRFIIDGIMKIELFGSLKSNGIKQKTAKPLSLVKLLWENDSGKDLTIIVKDEEIKVHKWVVSANSHILHSELTFSAAAETETAAVSKNVINIPEFSFETVKIAMEFCYERDIKNFISEKNASELLHFADKYFIKPLHDLLQTTLIKKLTEKNVCQFANISVTSNANVLREFCVCLLVNPATKTTVFEGIEELDDEIVNEIGRRAFLSVSK